MLALFRARRKIVHCILSVVCSGAFRARRKIVDYILLFVPERSVRKLLGTNNNNKQGIVPSVPYRIILLFVVRAGRAIRAHKIVLLILYLGENLARVYSTV